jgi:hypothetical protein
MSLRVEEAKKPSSSKDAATNKISLQKEKTE